jgi:hypothetical protein
MKFDKAALVQIYKLLWGVPGALSGQHCQINRFHKHRSTTITWGAVF